MVTQLLKYGLMVLIGLLVKQVKGQYSFHDTIPIDDKGYPSCDVSMDVLSILERDILQKGLPPDDPLYRHFLTPERKKEVKRLEKIFYSRRGLVIDL